MKKNQAQSTPQADLFDELRQIFPLAVALASLGVEAGSALRKFAPESVKYAKECLLCGGSTRANAASLGRGPAHIFAFS